MKTTKKFAKTVLIILLGSILCMRSIELPCSTVYANEEAQETDMGLSSPSYVLMEASTGTIIKSKAEHEVLRPASITKIMTLLLIFDALEKGSLKLEDTITVSEYAASMGGSQVFLEAGEIQSADTMIKCIAVASANDACVAMAEHICGSEEEFVRQMNERAKALGMNDTNFVNCNGLDADGHMTSAYDVALMSRELIIKYPQVKDYSTIWMENIIHETAKGSSEFGLANTNKLIKQYQYATGLKTGSTSLAKYCVSATANKDGMEMIAVIMAAPDYKVRFNDAATLLNYGYSVSNIYEDLNKEKPQAVTVDGGIKEQAEVSFEGAFRYLDISGNDLSQITKEVVMNDTPQAPIKKGDAAGEAIYSLNGSKLGSVKIIYDEEIAKAMYKDYFLRVVNRFLLCE